MESASTPVRIETERLVLRDRRPEDAEILHRLWTERDPRVPAHRRLSADRRPTVDEIAAGIRSGPGSGPRLLAVERAVTGDVIGYCGLVAPARPPSPSSPGPEIAFELLRAMHGRGYATEAGSAVLGWARELGMPRVWAPVWDWNLASRRVLRKLGFREVEWSGAVSAHGRSLLTVRDL
jgi:RimJ/RimL family protein N-acetyltransferase